ncbi:hypothetical protein SGGMMB4_05009 [Sodalis glossinidius str. 'morsitans']|uniref:Uncharacterized protein n=1 Tax=Sodalis glossinidius (strain morsitans) TaxID=343509 RepID=A0A193QML0_SODGM|nr:hypothetical protein SGGMMB4_05009 [Sodalis glossinidius str. 'morsitans']
MQKAGIGQQRDPGPFGGIDNRGDERVRLIVIPLAHLHAPLCQLVGLRRRTNDGDNLLRGHLFKQFFNNQTAKLAGRAGNRNHHSSSFQDEKKKHIA